MRRQMVTTMYNKLTCLFLSNLKKMYFRTFVKLYLNGVSYIAWQSILTEKNLKDKAFISSFFKLYTGSFKPRKMVMIS